MKINSAQFITSSPSTSQCPTDGRAEVAFIGRSNVGKSSLINMLTDKKGLAKTSQTPGKTQLINHFLINDLFYIVDLPGYGYAKVPKSQRQLFSNMIAEYVYERKQLVNLFILIDARHNPMEIDLEFINDMGIHGVPFSLVFTKTDKLSNTALQRNLETYKETLLETWEELPPYFLTSSTKGTGRDELLDYIEQIIQL